jgi:D-sedoheptulose 7-phosphate isomerase
VIELTDTVRDAFARGYIDEVSSSVAKLPLAQIARFAETVERAYRDDRQVFVIGNGGSASTASHMACDLAKNIYPATSAPGVRRFRVLSLTDNVALITALANDCGYDRVFAEQLSYYARPSDLVIAISASGNSPNVLEGLAAARTAGARTAALLGFDGGRARELADVSVVVDSRNYGHVEDAHLVVNHLVTAWMRRVVAELHRD